MHSQSAFTVVCTSAFTVVCTQSSYMQQTFMQYDQQCGMQQWDSTLFEALSKAGGTVYSNYAVGYNNVVVPDANKHGIAVGNTPGELTIAAVTRSLFVESRDCVRSKAVFPLAQGDHLSKQIISHMLPVLS